MVRTSRWRRWSCRPVIRLNKSDYLRKGQTKCGPLACGLRDLSWRGGWSWRLSSLQGLSFLLPAVRGCASCTWQKSLAVNCGRERGIVSSAIVQEPLIGTRPDKSVFSCLKVGQEQCVRENVHSYAYRLNRVHPFFSQSISVWPTYSHRTVGIRLTC